MLCRDGHSASATLLMPSCSSHDSDASHLRVTGMRALARPSLQVRPETSSALRADFKNVSIVAHYIKERTKDAQFIIISLRNNMFELADRLVRPRCCCEPDL